MLSGRGNQVVVRRTGALGSCCQSEEIAIRLPSGPRCALRLGSLRGAQILATDEDMAEPQAGSLSFTPENPQDPMYPTEPAPLEEVSTWMVDPHFREAQQTDITLRGLQVLTAVREGQILDSCRAERLPRIV